MKNKAEIWLEFTEEEEIYKPFTMTDQRFYTFSEIQPQIVIQYKNCSFLPQDTFIEPNSTDHSCDCDHRAQMTIKYYKN